MKNWQSENSSKFSFDYFSRALKGSYSYINRLTVKFFERLFSALSHMPFFITLQWFSGAEMDRGQTPDWDSKSQEPDLISDLYLPVRPTHCPLPRPTTKMSVSWVAAFLHLFPPEYLCTASLLLGQGRIAKFHQKKKKKKSKIWS